MGAGFLSGRVGRCRVGQECSPGQEAAWVLPPEASQPRHLPTSFPLPFSSGTRLRVCSPAPPFLFWGAFSGFCVSVFCTHSAVPGASLRCGLEPSLPFRPAFARCSVGPRERTRLVGARPGREALEQPACSLLTGRAAAQEGVGPVSPHAAYGLSLGSPGPVAPPRTWPLPAVLALTMGMWG